MQEADILKKDKTGKQGNGIIFNVRVECEILAAFTLRAALRSGLLLHLIHLSCCCFLSGIFLRDTKDQNLVVILDDVPSMSLLYW